MKLEVVPLPVRDVDAAKDFYTHRVGFALDNDVSPGNGMRIVQLTPPGSACSVVIGEGLPLGEPGSVKGVQLVVDDLDTLRNELVGRGVGISEVQQMGPEGMPGSRFCFFDDLDGNTWAVQEYKRSLSPAPFLGIVPEGCRPPNGPYRPSVNRWQGRSVEPFKWSCFVLWGAGWASSLGCLFRAVSAVPCIQVVP